ncbi:outer membrane beta-barrel protein [Sungkyunkwania multivorans]|uniref:Outer membrane beta-barrel protein n=1 Tax=Sungkyunkwania multivorans TaxID=1173618 RepID=A0ABW3D228_9FLAO
MNFKQSLLLVALSWCFVTNVFAQRPSYRIESGYGITVGAASYNINTDAFETTTGIGVTGGLHVKGGIEHRWYDVSFGIQFYDNNFKVTGTDISDNSETDIEYKLQAVQFFFLGHYKIARDHLYIDFGPSIQINDKLKLKNKSQEEILVNGLTDVTANEIREVSGFNVNLLLGFTAGSRSLKFRGQYQFGVNNILDKLNGKGLDPDEDKFKGRQGILSGSVIFYF